jgi:DNA-directed RNA polymerase specialized sigma24 family protein
MAERTDEHLLAGYRLGNRDDFDLLHDRWHTRLVDFFTGWRIGAEEAEEMAQLVWRRVGQNAYALSPGRDFAAWVHMTSMSLYRETVRYRPSAGVDHAASPPS